ncbi:hypothetical protein NKOR_00580 [Candidatus Nitrosopumilus koreensis AR1]|uniref:Uncharacterized protein n=1 Tax=Candidatus Nitrosopumilus koreensis AR1 TaxID=1229908 RepID=K0B3J2_9ARCH|nr:MULTISPECIES: hypothetical protein [Nitrosopumilus]AFS80034.1 hypothetical protein NKOR_00580 [Candidatus Nitrosopumilus koreensis AR1]
MNKGRPSKADQLRIEKKLRPYFEKMLTVSIASRETKINHNTVKKYYKKWYDEIASTEHPDFVKRSKIIISNSNIALDNQLSKLYKIQETLEKQITYSIEQNNGIPNLENNIYKTSILLIEKISDMILKKTNLTVTPTADIVLSREIKEYMIENGAV